jgi:hypothetical protein
VCVCVCVCVCARALVNIVICIPENGIWCSVETKTHFGQDNLIHSNPFLDKKAVTVTHLTGVGSNADRNG